MTVLWQGHEVDAYSQSSANNSEHAGAIEVTYERTGMRVARRASPTSVENGELRSHPDFAPQNEIWHRFNLYNQGGFIAYGDGAGGIPWAAERADGVKVARIIVADTSGPHGQMQVLIGGVMTNVGAPFILQGSSGNTVYHIHLKAAVAGKIEFWYGTIGAPTKILDLTGDYSGAANITRIFHSSIAGGFDDTATAHSIVQTTPTLASTSEIKPPTSNGGDLDGAGTYAAVDEATPYSDADMVTFSAAGQHQSFKAAARAHTQATVSGVTASCRAWYEAGGPTQLKPYLKIAGVRYYGTTFALDLVANAYQYTWQTNPATGVAFTPTEASDANLEWGWEAVA